MASQTSNRRELMIGGLLSLLLITTRAGITRTHFGDAFALPDASWAVFWLCGAFTTWRIWPVLLMIASLAIDYFVIAHGVSAYCFTPAYPFLVPAYLSLWFTGYWVRTHLHWQARSLLWLSASVLLGVTTCFGISNLGFYWASGYFAHMPALLYAQAVLRYWPHYLLTSSVYVAASLLVWAIWRGLQDLRAKQLQ